MKPTVKHSAGFFAICLVFSAAAFATPAENLISRTPPQTFFFAATSGIEALAEPFGQTDLGQIWNDPQVQTFVKTVLDQISEPNLAADDSGDMARMRTALQLARMALRKPCLFGSLYDPQDASDFGAFYVLLDAGEDKPRYDQFMENELPSLLDIRPESGYMGSVPVRQARLCEKTVLYWGWQDTLLIVGINDPKGLAVSRLRRASGAGLPPQLAGLAEHGDALAVYFNTPMLMAAVKAGSEQKSPGDFAQAEAVLRELGMGDLGPAAIRIGFEGQNVAAEGFVELPAPHTGLPAALFPVDRDLLCKADPKAFDVCAFSVRPDAVYDAVLSALKTAAGEDFDEVEAQLGKIEKEIGFSIRGDLLGSMTGAFAIWTIPAWTNPEAPNGGGGVIARLKSPEAMHKSLTALQTLLQSKVPQGQLQIQTQQRGGRDVHIFVSPFLSMMQVLPCWVIEGDCLVIASHPALTDAACTRAAPADTTGSFCAGDEFSAYRDWYPAGAWTITYSDTKTQMRQTMTQLQQIWPMLTMAASEEGLRLPMMLPNISSHIEKLGPSVSYSLLTPRGLECRYVGLGVQSNTDMASTSGSAMMLAILMPALSRTKQISQRVVSGTNLKSIGAAAYVYANDHDGRFPPDLETLIREADLSPKMLESPYTKSAPGPDYYYVSGLSDRIEKPAETLLAFDNPRLVRDKINVLFVDGHVELMDPPAFARVLRATYEGLGRPLPAELADYVAEISPADSPAPSH